MSIPGKYAPLFFILLLALSIQSTELTIENIFTSPDFKGETLSGISWVPNKNAFTYIKKDKESGNQEIFICDAATGIEQVLFDNENLTVLEKSKSEKRFTLPSYKWAPDGISILIPANNDLYILSTVDKKLEKLTNDSLVERDPIFSPDSKQIAYIKEKDLFVLDLKNKTEKQLTFKGSDNILVGRFDWVYEEEFSMRTGFAWSPDSKHIAFYLTDQSNVPEYTIANIIPTYSTSERLKYPKAGQPNSLVKIGIINTETKKTIYADKYAGPDSYISRTQWTSDGQELAIVYLNRDQNELDIIFADVKTGKTRPVLKEQTKDGWLEPGRSLYFIDGKNEFIWESENDGYNHLYRYDYNGQLKKQLTTGEWDVFSIVNVNPKSKKIFFYASPKMREEKHLFTVGINGKALKQVTTQPGTHNVNMNKSGNYYIDAFSNWETPTTQILYKSNGKKIKNLNNPKIKALQQTELAKIDFLNFTSTNGHDLPAYIIKPLNFDPTKKYPVLIYTYGGPGSQVVNNSWLGTRAFWYTLLTQKNYLICAVDGRGTKNRGRKWKHLCYKKLGEIEIQDQIEAAKYLQSLPFVNKNRIGIWGWSYGGYTTIMALLKGAEYFKMGIAVAPVTDWRNYDTIYTERFMDQPQDNEDGYNNGAATTFAKNLKGKLLLIHGGADDNVHLSNTMQLAKAFQRHKKQFDLMVYPNKLHGIRGTNERVHLYTLMTNYILENL
jgi:dipeptidyl-peptidase 4